MLKGGVKAKLPNSVPAQVQAPRGKAALAIAVEAMNEAMQSVEALDSAGALQPPAPPTQEAQPSALQPPAPQPSTRQLPAPARQLPAPARQLPAPPTHEQAQNLHFRCLDCAFFMLYVETELLLQMQT